ncbi:bifunctional adenosylcobinamide kinase/adenosylcobinamide-phosphate guanylyltransferase [Huintestinicola sp.]
MMLIIGGAYEGKTEYAEAIGISDICDGETAGFEEIKKHKCVKNYQMLVKRQLEAGLDPLNEAKKLFDKCPDIVIISTEIGCGIVPIEKSERIWRETVGKVCCFIAAKSEKVIRISCSIASVIKGNG